MSNKKSKSKSKSQPNKKTTNPTWLWIVLGIAAVILIGFFLIQRSNDQTTSILSPEISVTDAAAKREAGAFMLDVREPAEWEEYHIPGAILIPLGELASRVHEVPRDQEVVVYCRSGNRSQEGRDILKQAGFQNVTSMAGGIKNWAANGYPTETGP